MHIPARTWIVPALVGGMLLAAACAKVPNRRYFTLDYPATQTHGADKRPPLHPVRVRVRPFGIALPYNQTKIVYRESPYQFGYYNFRLWAAKPQRMMRELAMRYLEASRLVAEVSQEYGEDMPHYELSAEILSIEELDAGDTWFGHLAMRLELVRFKDRMPIWTYTFDRKEKVFEHEPVYVVRAISRIAEDEMRKIAAELDVVISRDRNVTPTLTAPTPGQVAPPLVQPPDAEPRHAPATGPKALPRPQRRSPVPVPKDDRLDPSDDGIIDPDDQIIDAGSDG